MPLLSLSPSSSSPSSRRRRSRDRLYRCVRRRPCRRGRGGRRTPKQAFGQPCRRGCGPAAGTVHGGAGLPWGPGMQTAAAAARAALPRGRPGEGRLRPRPACGEVSADLPGAPHRFRSRPRSAPVWGKRRWGLKQPSPERSGEEEERRGRGATPSRASAPRLAQATAARGEGRKWRVCLCAYSNS